MYGGFVDNRLWGCYVDPNYGAILSIISAIISLCYLTGKKDISRKIKTALIVNIIIEYLYFCYADSRTGLLAVVAAVVIVCALWVSKSKGIVKSIALAVVLSTILVFCSYGIRNVTSYARVEIAKITAARAGLSPEEIAMEMYLARVGRIDEQIGGGTDVTNNRLAIWGNAIEIFKQHPIVGISYRNIREYAYDKIPDTYAGFESMHNFFFDILVSQGIIGVAILFMLMGWVIWILIKKYKALTDYREFAFMMAIIAAIFASMLTYSETFYMNTGGAFIFWYVLGYLVNFKEKKEIEEVK
jgi:O-antigen ligase